MDLLISIIIPIYNVEEYLERCIDSVVNQTYKNLEIILVDDGSPDQCGSICDTWALKDKRIKVIHKKNGGLSDARNAGLNLATGEFIAFVDSDDVVERQFVRYLIDTVCEENADIVECGVQKFCTDIEFPAETKGKVTSFSRTEALRELIFDGAIRQHVWNKLYRKSVIADIRFPVGKLNEDEFWTYKIVGRAEKICRIENELYGYFQREGSIMGTRYSVRRLDALEAKAERLEYMSEFYPELEEDARLNFYYSCRYAGQMSLRYIKEKKERRNAVRKIKELYSANSLTREDIRSAKGKEKMEMILSTVSFMGCCRIRNLLYVGF